MIGSNSPHYLTQQFLEGADATTRADNAWCASLDKLLKRLDAAEYLERLDVLNLAAPVESDSLRNIISPGTHDSINQNSCVFTAKRGFQTLGVSTSASKHIEVQYQMLDGQNSKDFSSFFTYIRNTSTSTYSSTPTPSIYALMGVNEGGPPSTGFMLTLDPTAAASPGELLVQHNNTGSFRVSGIACPAGFVGSNRSGMSYMQWASKTGHGIIGASSVALASPAHNVYIGCHNILTTQQFGPVPYVEHSGWGFGGGIGDSATASAVFFSFQQMIQDFMDEIGAGV
jgi:hypothetical protein